MRAMLLCAGLGSRLGALSDERPKPMLPVCGMPILRYGIAQLVGHGIADIVINVHHRGDVIERELGDGRAFGARISYSYEDVLLGTGGGLKHALPLLSPDGRDEPFISMNGKLIFDLDFTALRQAFTTALTVSKDLLGMMVVRQVSDAVAWGAVDVRMSGPGGSSRIVNILGEGEHMFCGVHITRPTVVSRLPDGDACMIRQGYLPWLRAGASLAAFEHARGYFAEHSTAERYLASNFDLLGGTELSYSPGELLGVASTARVHKTAHIIAPVRIGAGAVIEAGTTIGPGTVIGAGATVDANVRVARSVVWDGARVSTNADHCIITPNGRVATGG